jgi:putative Mn2+ efflux pump MntP
MQYRFDSGYTLTPKQRRFPLAFWLVVILGIALLIVGLCRGAHYEQENQRTAVPHSAVTGSAAVSMDEYGMSVDYVAGGRLGD